MLDQLAKMNMSIYFQTIVFIIFIGVLLRLHLKIGSFMHVATAVVKYVVLTCVFLYIFLNWASDVNPSLRESSLLIMTLINLYLLWQVLVSAVELPYRRALQNCVDGICTATDLEHTFATGRRYYKSRYFWASLSSGIAPWRFLRGIAAERTRDDLHRVFVSLDPKGSLFGANLYNHFLQHHLNADKSMAADKRGQRQQAIAALTGDPWLSETTSDFLHHLLADPEALLEKGLNASLKDSGKVA